MADKLLVRVLAAVQAGLGTTAAIAVYVQAHPKNVYAALSLLAAGGEIERDGCVATKRGRPLDRWRISQCESGISQSQSPP